MPGKLLEIAEHKIVCIISFHLWTFPDKLSHFRFGFFFMFPFLIHHIQLRCRMKVNLMVFFFSLFLWCACQKVITNAENNGLKILKTMSERSTYFWMWFYWYSHWSCYHPHIFPLQKHYGKGWPWSEQLNDMQNRETTIINMHVSKHKSVFSLLSRILIGTCISVCAFLFL